ncbi:patatin-like phospholipase family protein [Nubsella zeaxanthinifaciens]|uniref:patatin-like phospholipase family protein n=1 Tax=Nubsella zeaxanthinifaciens TaxID=392412 RepID=UPI000DE1D0C2|nr:patatin-like phospholipase family protein [Nubsella zeaxanthinifaciens]
MKKKVQLVLGSGGARGLAHIGVIEQLENDGYEICEVVGCSMGAVVGGLYCAGFLNEYKHWLSTLTRGNVFSLVDFTFNSRGFVRGEKIWTLIAKITGDQQIEKLKIPFTAVATDMMQMEEVHYTSGDLFAALRSTISIPGVFTPVIEKNSVLVDGGVLNPLPINVVKKRKDAIVVAVNINGKNTHHVSEEIKEKNQSWLQRYWKNNAKNDTPKISFFDLMNTSYDFTQDRLAQLTVEHYQPDLVVEIPRNACGTFDFHKSAQLIELGKQAYNKAKTS